MPGFYHFYLSQHRILPYWWILKRFKSQITLQMSYSYICMHGKYFMDLESRFVVWFCQDFIFRGKRSFLTVPFPQLSNQYGQAKENQEWGAHQKRLHDVTETQTQAAVALSLTWRPKWWQNSLEKHSSCLWLLQDSLVMGLGGGRYARDRLAVGRDVTVTAAEDKHNTVERMTN